MNHSIYKRDNIITIMSNRFHECLEIEIPTFNLKYTNEKKSYGQKLLDCYGIIGIIDVINASYIVCITEVELSLVLFKKEIYKIKKVEFISCSSDTQSGGEDLSDYFNQGPTKEEMEENNNILAELRKIFSKGFYFSNKYDLANSFSSHNQVVLSKSNESSNVVIDYDHIIDGNRNFLANWKFINKLILPNQKNNTRVFVSNCIYGNIETFSFDIKGKNNLTEKIQIILISRRNLWNYSLFNYKKGLSKNGYNSDLVETELIMIYNNADVYTHVFLSSYLPIFFKNKASYTVNTVNKAFNNYFKSLIKEYNLLVMVGLEEENDNKYFEIFNNLVLKNKNELGNKLKYFCINAQIKTIKDILKQSIEKGLNILDILGFSHFDKGLKYKDDFFQVGAFYFCGLNDECVHNNQFYLVYKIISNIYKKISDSELKITKNENFVEGLKIIFQRRKNVLISQYKPQADIESIEKKQRILEIIFGKSSHKDLKEDFRYLREDFSSKDEIKIFIGSWNVGSTNLTKYPNMNLDSWLIPKDKIIPNIYFVGLQEVVELNAGNIVLNLEDREKVLYDWSKKIENSIQKVGNYYKLMEMNLVGINLYCYVLDRDYENITNLTKKYVKTGFGGAGNKGSCCINFNYYSTSISVACSHLAAGEKKNKQRLKEISQVLRQKLSSFIKPDEMNTSSDEEYTESNEVINEVNDGSLLFKDSDAWILFGDLNFRIDMNYDEFSEFIKSGQNWTKLLEYDQFNKNQKASIEFTEIIDEDPIIHPPSYKYIIGSDQYDYDSKEKNEDEPNNVNVNANLSGKKRNPSWCDRIFYKKNTYTTKDERKIIKSLGYYNCAFDASFQSSDHRPIFNIFDVVVFRDDEAKKKEIERKVSFNNRLNISSKYLQKKVFDN